jgi:hypothetical protein
MKIKFLTCFFLLFPVLTVSGLELSRFELIKKDTGRLETMQPRSAKNYAPGEILFLLFEAKNILLKEKRGKLRWYFEFYRNDQLNTRLIPETYETSMKGKFWNYWRVKWWRVPDLPGNYKIIFTIFDEMKKIQIRRSLSFQVRPEIWSKD